MGCSTACHHDLFTERTDAKRRKLREVHHIKEHEGPGEDMGKGSFQVDERIEGM